jgi:hypothetical protein
MKKILILLMLFVTIPMYSQSRLGSPLDSIRMEFSEPKYNAQSGTTINGDMYYSIYTPGASVVYLFDIFNICYVVQIDPKNDAYLSWYKEKYNKDFRKKSDVRWKAKIDKVVAYIVLTCPDSTKHSDRNGYDPYFTWTFAK